MRISLETVQSIMECEEDGCENEAAVRLHIPWADNRDVCTAHARVLVQKDGIVAEPLKDVEWR